MTVETVDQEDAIIIEAAKAQQKAMLDGTEPPEIIEVEAEKPEEEQEAQEENKPESDDPVELSSEQKLQAAYEDRIQKLERALAKTNGTYGNELQNLRAKLAEVESRKEHAVKSITPANASASSGYCSPKRFNCAGVILLTACSFLDSTSASFALRFCNSLP